MTVVEMVFDRATNKDENRSVAGSDERKLIERSVTDPAAVASLYRRHHAAISKYISRRVGCSHDTEDLIADTFMAMVKYLPRYRVRGTPFRSWLYRLATTQVNRWAKKRRSAAMKALAMHAEQTAKANPSDISQTIDVEQVRLALISLPHNFQTVLSLHYMEGMSVVEIAEVLGCAEGTIKSRLARGREKMRIKLGSRENRNDR